MNRIDSYDPLTFARNSLGNVMKLKPRKNPYNIHYLMNIDEDKQYTVAYVLFFFKMI